MPYVVHPRPKSDGQENYAGILDLLTTIDVSNCASWKQRNRYEHSLALPHPGPVRECERGRENVYILKEERERQRPFNETLGADLG